MIAAKKVCFYEWHISDVLYLLLIRVSTFFISSILRQKPTQIFDVTSEHRWVEEYSNIKNEKVYIIEHREDKMGRGPHFYIADDEKRRDNQHPGHYPEDFEGYKKRKKRRNLRCGKF